MTIEQSITLALQHHQSGRLSEAEAIYRSVLAAAPNHAPALHLLGVAVGQRGQVDQAVILIERALMYEPNASRWLSDLGVFLKALGRLDEALAAINRAIALEPAYAPNHSNLGTLLLAKNNTDDALVAFYRAIELAPKYADAYFNLASALRQVDRIDEAIAALKKTIDLQPDHANAHKNLGWLLLSRGEFTSGWPEHDWHGHTPATDWGRPRAWSQPRWNGGPLAGRRILLFADLGLGDTINFVRYVPMVAARGGAVVVECQPELHRLFSSHLGADRVVACGAPLAPFDVQCPVSLLPGLFTPNIASIPPPTPFIRADCKLLETWRERIGEPRGKRRIGLVWRSGSTFATHAQRNIPLKSLGPLAGVKGTEFYSLQKGAGIEEIPGAPEIGLIDQTSAIEDLADTAALIHLLDLVITVDTSVAHLAGAMGKKTWLMLPACADWRWLLHRNDSPWYPSMQLFRQKSPRDWSRVVDEIRNRLGSV